MKTNVEKDLENLLTKISFDSNAVRQEFVERIERMFGETTYKEDRKDKQTNLDSWRKICK